MGQKTHPLGFRLGITQTHLSEWYAAQQYAQFIHEDHLIRMFIFKELTGTDSGAAKPLKATPTQSSQGQSVVTQDGLPKAGGIEKPTAYMTKRSEGQTKATGSPKLVNVNGDAGLSKTLIYRHGDRIKVEVHVAQPKIATGEGGSRLKELTQGLSNVVTALRKSIHIGRSYQMYRRLASATQQAVAETECADGYHGHSLLQNSVPREALSPVAFGDESLPFADVSLNVIQIIDPRIDVNVLAQRIAQQLERRIAYRRVMKQSIKDASEAGVEGIKIEISGRLNGAEIARSETIKNGTLPLHTLRARIDYCSHRAETIYGTLGIKVWIHKKAL